MDGMNLSSRHGIDALLVFVLCCWLLLSLDYQPKTSDEADVDNDAVRSGDDSRTFAMSSLVDSDRSASIGGNLLTTGKAQEPPLKLFLKKNNPSKTQPQATLFTILALGDWGGTASFPYSTEAQRQTGQAMMAMTTTEKKTILSLSSQITTTRQESSSTSIVLALGDNFYHQGIPPLETALAQTRMAETFEHVYPLGGRQQNDTGHTNSSNNDNNNDDNATVVPWYVVAGNHDYLGNMDSQLHYHGQRWHFPHYYYKTSHVVPQPQRRPRWGPRRRTRTTQENTTIDVIHIDTIILAGLPRGIPPFRRIVGPDNVTAAEQEWVWIEQELNRSTADYLLVVGHYPVYSVCKHGNTPLLVKRLEPLLQKYQVTAYLSGHDHCQMHIQRGQMEYLLSGTGMECCYSASQIHHLPNDAQLPFLLAHGSDYNPHNATGGFARLQLVQYHGGAEHGGGNQTTVSSTTAMHVTLCDQNGKNLYQTKWYPRLATKRAET